MTELPLEQNAWPPEAPDMPSGDAETDLLKTAGFKKVQAEDVAGSGLVAFLRHDNPGESSPNSTQPNSPI